MRVCVRVCVCVCACVYACVRVCVYEHLFSVVVWTEEEHSAMFLDVGYVDGSHGIHCEEAHLGVIQAAIISVKHTRSHMTHLFD